MRTDTIIREEGMQALLTNLGMVEAERFIMLVQREPFDYTQWHENLFEDMTLKEICDAADKYCKENVGN
ncbi:MAG: hypothetical protein LBR86_03425 [Tannerella sp.]|jgi:hypothetical protein|nr:hypothetical protein [Tannerella sp.]